MSSVKFIYVRDEKKFPVGCFAYRILPANPVAKDRIVLEFGYSIYNPQDKFDRRSSRAVAESRLITACMQNSGDGIIPFAVARMLQTVADEEFSGFNAPNAFRLPNRFKKACANMADKLVTRAMAKTIHNEADNNELLGVA
ncbi:MAG: hypothetical protein Q8O87_02470 [bacterium]|nr:hypothetical protein [bacterium]